MPHDRTQKYPILRLQSRDVLLCQRYVLWTSARWEICYYATSHASLQVYRVGNSALMASRSSAAHIRWIFISLHIVFCTGITLYIFFYRCVFLRRNQFRCVVCMGMRNDITIRGNVLVRFGRQGYVSSRLRRSNSLRFCMTKMRKVKPAASSKCETQERISCFFIRNAPFLVFWWKRAEDTT